VGKESKKSARNCMAKTRETHQMKYWLCVMKKKQWTRKQKTNQREEQRLREKTRDYYS